AVDLLPGAVAALGSRTECPRAGCPGRYGWAARLFLLDRDLAAGSLLPGRSADPRRDRAVPRHLDRRPGLVRIHLPPDGVDRPLYAGRALDRGRPQQAHQAGRGTMVGPQAGPEIRQAWRVAADRVRDRRRLDH